MKYPWWRRFLIVLPLAAGVAVFLYFAGNKQTPVESSVAERFHDTRVIPAPAVTVVPRVRGYGTVQPARVWSIVARVSGEIDYLHPHFKSGEILNAGTELLRISARDYQLAIKQAEANIRAAQARVDELKVQRENAGLSLSIEKQAFDLATRDLERKKTLRQQGTIAQTSVDAAETVLLLQRQKVQNLQNSLGLIPTQIAAQKQMLEVDQALLETAQLNLERTSITLPFDARISAMDVELSQYVQTGGMLGSADSIETTEVIAQVPLTQFATFMRLLLEDEEIENVAVTEFLRELIERKGLVAHIRLSEAPDNPMWQGRVLRITDTIDPETGTVGVVVGVDNPYEKTKAGTRPLLRKGMFVLVDIVGAPLGQRIIVPRSALLGNSLYIVGDDDRLERRKVEIALTQDGFSVISNGLAVGERVVVSDLLYATDGQLMRVHEDTVLSEAITAEAGDAQ